jgi:two-component system cell cycle sensor histidine kinase/response regulator CckA
MSAGCQPAPVSRRRPGRVTRHHAVRRTAGRARAHPQRAILLEVIEQVRDAIFVTDTDTGHIRYANRGAARDLGCAREDLVGRQMGDVEPGLTDDRFRSIVDQLRSDDTTLVAYDTTHRRIDGSEHPVHVRIQLVETEAGEQCLVFAEPAPERRGPATERERLPAAIEQFSDAIMVLDDDGRITYVNEAFVAATGFERAALYGQPPTILSEPDVPGSVLRWASAASAAPWSGTLTALGRDGRRFEAEWAVAPIRDAAGLRSGHVAVARDRSRERALEAQVARIQRMEAVGQLAAGIAHDFNNLLAAASGYAELLREPLPPGDPRRADLEQIIAATDRGATLVRQLLAFSRRAVMQPEVIDLGEVIGGVVPMLRRLLGEQVELATRNGEDLGRVMADPSQLEQVLVNLATNARDAMPSGGRLTIETRNVDLDEAYASAHAGVTPGPYVLLAVSDTGIGMEPETLAHMFEPFFTTKGPERGTGLGLATVHGIVNQTGGHVWAYSEPGQGTSFKVYLPRIEEAAASRKAAHLPATSGGTETILVVEDEEAVRTLVRRVLERYGYRVITASGPHEALSLPAADLASIDLLVTDMVMPGLSGPELAAMLMDRQPHLRVLCMSGYADLSAEHQGLGGVATEFIAKPFTAPVLGRKVRELLDAGRA